MADPQIEANRAQVRSAFAELQRAQLEECAGYNPFVEEIRTTSETGGQKGSKPERYDLIPVDALATIARLYGKGAEKYAVHNWRKGYEWSKSYTAMQRHANAFWNGEDNDPEMELPHMAAVAFHALTLLTFMQEQPGFDDRYKA